MLQGLSLPLLIRTVRLPEDDQEEREEIEARLEARFDEGDDGAVEERSQAYQRLRRELLDAERAALLQLRRERRIGDDILQRIQQDLDLEDTRPSWNAACGQRRLRTGV